MTFTERAPGSVASSGAEARALKSALHWTRRSASGAIVASATVHDPSVRVTLGSSLEGAAGASPDEQRAEAAARAARTSRGERRAIDGLRVPWVAGASSR